MNSKPKLYREKCNIQCLNNEHNPTSALSNNISENNELRGLIFFLLFTLDICFRSVHVCQTIFGDGNIWYTTVGHCLVVTIRF